MAYKRKVRYFTPEDLPMCAVRTAHCSHSLRAGAVQRHDPDRHHHLQQVRELCTLLKAQLVEAHFTVNLSRHRCKVAALHSLQREQRSSFPPPDLPTPEQTNC